MKPPCGTPCRECPWRREATPGWLGPWTAEEWRQLAHSDELIACHLTIGDETNPARMTQCSGSAIYRRNVAKSPRDRGYVALPADRETVFASPMEFVAHHDRRSAR